MVSAAAADGRAAAAAAATPATAGDRMVTPRWVLDPPSSAHHRTGYADLLDLLRPQLGQRRVVALTGAGLSTESGIPDYRGTDGTRRVVPMSLQELLGSTDARRRYWARSFIGWQRFRAATPNAGHRAVADLQRLGVLGPVITQNVDGLHQQAGAREVTELHGSLARVVCLRCGQVIDRGEHHAAMAAANPGFEERFARQAAALGSQWGEQVRPDGDLAVPDELVAGFVLPTCTSCGSDLLKPDVVFFGESVPPARVENAYAAVDSAHVLLVLGSSLAVMSGYRFVRRAATLGIPVAMVTRGVTRGDAEVEVKLDAPLGATLTRIAHDLRADCGDVKRAAAAEVR